MDLSKDWIRSEFINHEILEQHRILENELTFYNAIVDGNIEYIEGMGKLSENKLQNIRYHFVVTTAMITRYCVHGGMEQEKAYALSDFYILKMDKCHSIQEIADLHDTMCLDFCNKMNVQKKKSDPLQANRTMH
mgnify:CR=1 FL=1